MAFQDIMGRERRGKFLFLKARRSERRMREANRQIIRARVEAQEKFKNSAVMCDPRPSTTRRSFLAGLAALATVAVALPTLPAVSPVQAATLADYLGFVSAKDSQFGWSSGGTAAANTAALQSWLDYCFGSLASPHGTALVTSNKVAYMPNGLYDTDAPLKVKYLHGGRIIGAGRFVTKIVNGTNNSNCFETNGCGYSRIEGILFQAQGTGKAFDLSWDGTAGGAALQSNTFLDCFFYGGSIGVDIGNGGYMGSENLFLNCFFYNCSIAGTRAHNFNAVQNSIIAGNIQLCAIGVLSTVGSFTLVQSVGFQVSSDCDIKNTDASSNTMTVDACRTESSNFIKNDSGRSISITSCDQYTAGTRGFFLQSTGGYVDVSASKFDGQVKPTQACRLSVRVCHAQQVAPGDWLVLDPTLLWYDGVHSLAAIIELENVVPSVGGVADTPNGILKQRRYTTDGLTITTKNYDVT